MRTTIGALVVLGIFTLGGLGYAALQVNATGANCCGHCEMQK